MDKRKLILSSSVANIFEWYDYALFGHFASIIAIKFFPDSDLKVSLLNTFLIFAIGYLMRPIGGVFFGILGDKFGRRTALSAAVICMAFPTAVVGMIPTYETIGISSSVIMVIVRMLQGLSMGGALTGSISFLIEHTDKKHRGFMGSVSMASVCVGILIGSLVSYTIKTILSPEQFLNWGWRLPFLFGIFIMFVGIYIRYYTQETPLFESLQNNNKVTSSPLREVVCVYWFDIIISIFINATGSVIFYLQAIYMISFLKLNRGFNENVVDDLANICYLIMAITALLTGWLSDLVGRRRIYIINLLIIVILIFIIMQMLEYGNFISIVIAQIILSVLAAIYVGPEPALQAEFYPTNVRSTALSLSYNVATSIFGGSTPYVMEYLVQKTDSISSCAYYILICSVLSIGALFFYKDRCVL